MNFSKIDFPKLFANRKVWIGAALALVLLFSFMGFNGVQKDMVKKETALSAQYLDNQNELSTYISKIKEQVGLQNTATAALDKVLTDAVKGRYDQGSSAQPGGGALFSAIIEAYPDLSKNQEGYQLILNSISSGREAYKNAQTKLLDMLRDYDTWRNSGFVHSKVASMVGAPSNNLVARIGTQTSRGQDALDQMYVIVLASNAVDAYKSGTLDPLDLGPQPAK